MKKKALRAGLICLVVAIVLAVTAELGLDRFVDYQITEEMSDKAVYQLFPDGGPVYVNCVYKDGTLIPENEDPQMIWSVSHDVPLSDLMIRFGEPIAEECEIKVYYDDTGEGFYEEKTVVVEAQEEATDILVPLQRNYYYGLRVDINGTVPLSQIDCDSTVILRQKVMGAFHVARCVLICAVLTLLLLLLYQYRNYNSCRNAVHAFGGFIASDLFWAFLVSVAFSAYISLYYHLCGINSLDDAAFRMLHPFWPVCVGTFLILYGGMYVSKDQGFSIGDWLYEKRWLLGMCLLAICVLFNLNISSLHEWAGYLGNNINNGVLLGVSRTIRSDEWAKAIGVLKALGYENYPVFSNLIRATSTENVMIAGQVAWDISTIFRPFTWGVLLLGSVSRGLSSNQFGMIIVLFLASFDFFMLLSNNRKLSFAFACVLLFSPFVQWWTCYNLFCCVFVLLLAAHKYLTAEKIKKKLLYAACVTVFMGNFALVLYPAWQVPAAYVMLGGLIWLFIRDRNNLKMSLKIDLPIIGGAILFMLACGIFIYLRSAPAIHDMVNTVYPGAVRNSAPTSVNNLYMTYLNMFSPYTEQFIPGPNLSESADFMSFFPAGLLLCVFAMIWNRKADAFSIIMIVLSAFFAAFTFLNVSDTLRKLTFMSYSFSQRILPWFGFVQIVLLFRGVSLLRKSVRWYLAVPAAALFAWYVVRKISFSPIVAGHTMILVGIGILLFVILWAALRAGSSERAKRFFATVMAFFALFSAGMVHPIQTGMAEIEQSEVVRSIRAITEKDPTGKWLVESLSYPYAMVPLMGGAPTINCVNNYPNLEMWYKLDPERDDEFVYNRYASQIVTNLVEDGETTISVGWVADIIMLQLNVDDLRKMDVSYILTNRDLEGFSSDEVTFTRVAAPIFFRVYHVDYSDTIEHEAEASD